jgi:hypothetical protein
MFGRTENDMRRTLEMMRAHAIEQCNFDQAAAERLTAALVKQDRRFDNCGVSPAELAREAFESKRSGRAPRVAPEPYRTSPIPPQYNGR